MGFMNKIKNFLNTLKIKSSEKEYANLKPVFETNSERVKEATSSVKINPYFSAYMKPVDGARYCVTTYEEGRPFYVLTFYIDNKGNSVKSSKEVTEAVLSELKVYLNAKGGANEKKSYYNAAAAVLSEIDKAIGDKTLVGFACDKNTADSFAGGANYTINTSAEVLNDAWSKVRSASGRSDILNQVLGEKKKVVPSSIMGKLCALDKPFDTFYWKIVKHQTQYTDPIDETAFGMVEQFSEFREVLQSGNNLSGLNFGKIVQLKAINAALALGGEYIDSLRTENGWLGESAMERKLEEMQKVMEQNGTSFITPKMRQEMDQKKAERELQKVKENIPLQVELGRVKAEIDLLKAEKSNTYDVGAQIRLARQIEALEEQYKEIERKMR